MESFVSAHNGENAWLYPTLPELSFTWVTKLLHPYCYLAQSSHERVHMASCDAVGASPLRRVWIADTAQVSGQTT